LVDAGQLRLPVERGLRVRMDFDLEFIRLVEMLYLAAADPVVWPAALENLVAAFRSDHAMLFTNKASAVASPFAVMTGLTNEDVARFTSPEGVRLWAPWQALAVPGRAMTVTDFLTEREFQRTEVYNEIIKPTRGLYAGLLQQDVPDLSFHLAVCRKEASGAFDADETMMIQRLAPHLTTAMTLHQRLRISDERGAGFATVLERMDEAAIVLDAALRLLIVNARASDILRQDDGLSLQTSGLRAATSSLTEQLHDAIAATTASDAAGIRRLALARQPPRLPLLLTIMPIWRLDRSEPGMREPRVAIFVREPDAPPDINKEALSDIFALTPRECEIACLLAQGQSIDTMASRLGVRIVTIRQNLKRVFEKAGVHSQAALVALVRGFAR
jgi:DNA-binding CsgD family transcriptional regulator/PAS domain-containing protein